jgi:hypothetical protein
MKGGEAIPYLGLSRVLVVCRCHCGCSSGGEDRHGPELEEVNEQGQQ